MPLAGCLAGGLAPDADFVLIAFPFFNDVHRVLTHNVFFVAAVALLAAAIVKDRKGAHALAALMCGLLHLFIDSVMDDNPTNGLGVALFWPLSGDMFQPFNVLAVDWDSQGWRDRAAAVRKMAVPLLMELPFALAAAYLWRRDSRGA